MVDVRADGPAQIAAQAVEKPVLVVVEFNLPTAVDIPNRISSLIPNGQLEQISKQLLRNAPPVLPVRPVQKTVLANAGAVSAVGKGGGA